MAIVKVLTYKQAGRPQWEILKTFDSFGEADAWLTEYIKSNHYIPTDFTITKGGTK